MVRVDPVVKTVPSTRVNTPPAGIEVTVIVRESPSASVGAPMLNEASVSSVKLKVVFAPMFGALLLGGGVGVELPPPPPPPPQAAKASIAKLLNKKEEGPLSLNCLLTLGSSFLRRLIKSF